MKKILSAAAVALLATAAPAFAATPINVPFASATGAQSADTYYGLVNVTVSGTGFANGTARSDAFYTVANGSRNSGLYQLAFTTGSFASSGATVGQAVSNFIVGSVPAFNAANNTYSFTLNTGLTQALAGRLTFGLIDEIYGDNGAAAGNSYTIQVSQAVPEPATWGMMLVGFGMIGFGLRSYQRKSTKVTYA